ncbi:MAG TPA: hypothetical protein VHY91_24535 [Pirellulales bacterium]|jgi:hypothetical protein|nr:hypothetical protein [Pirellulales bacterium]
MAKQQPHALESKYGLTSIELLDAINARFRLKVALEGAVAEVQMEKLIAACVGHGIQRYETHDLDGHPDFSIWLRGRRLVLVECKNIRESGKEGGEAYRIGGKVVGYKVETQKTRAATGDKTSRFYGVDQFHILGVCLGKKTGDWSDFVFGRTIDLRRHEKHPHKLAVFQRVPLPDASDRRPWYADLSELIRHIDDPPYEAALSN